MRNTLNHMRFEQILIYILATSSDVKLEFEIILFGLAFQLIYQISFLGPPTIIQIMHSKVSTPNDLHYSIQFCVYEKIFKLRVGASTSRFCLSVGQKKFQKCQKLSKTVKKLSKNCQKTVKNVKKCQKCQKVSKDVKNVKKYKDS